MLAATFTDVATFANEADVRAQLGMLEVGENLKLGRAHLGQQEHLHDTQVSVTRHSNLGFTITLTGIEASPKLGLNRLRQSFAVSFQKAGENLVAIGGIETAEKMEYDPYKGKAIPTGNIETTSAMTPGETKNTLARMRFIISNARSLG
ncbi:MAG TPA: hypothetical protein PLK94_01105 [Alphaproteobacteria bacterium]|nr:hypothetical protein [Alphaproteobacteria bacterium]HOO49865.1 hypothetical protein [Alphaproteobacteria bacterium]